MYRVYLFGTVRPKSISSRKRLKSSRFLTTDSKSVKSKNFDWLDTLVGKAGKAIVEVKVNQVFGKFIVKHELLKRSVSSNKYRLNLYPKFRTQYFLNMKMYFRNLWTLPPSPPWSDLIYFFKLHCGKKLTLNFYEVKTNTFSQR